jgi:hypothetical protein
MRDTRRRTLTILHALIAIVGLPLAASAQTTSEPWPGLKSSGLQTVYVLDRSGSETTGKLLALHDDALLLLIEGSERRFDRDDIARVQSRDSLKNGTIAGAVVGALMGLVVAGISDCPGDDPGGSCAGFRATALVMSTLTYTAFGTGVDAMIRGRTTIYSAPQRQAASSTGFTTARRPLLQVGLAW